MAIDKALYKDKRLTESEKKKIKPANQGGGPNYLGKQETVTVPKKWLSDPDHVVAELAYITPKEQKILLDANLYGSLKGKPNKGPGGIMSLQGDLGGYSAGAGGTSSGAGAGDSGAGKGGKSTEDYKQSDYYKMMTGTGTTATSSTGDTYRSNKVAQGAVPEYVNTPQGTQYVGSQFKSYGQPSFFGDLFSAGASGYRGTYGTRPNFFQRMFGSGNQMGSINTRINPNTGQLEYYSENEKVGDVKPGFLESLSNFGIMGILKNVFKKPSMYEDMSKYNRLGLFGIDPVLSDAYSDMKISDTSFSPNVNIPTVPNFINPPGQIDDTGIQYSVPSASPQEYDFFSNAMAKLNKVEQRAYDTLKMGKDLGMNTEEQNKQLEELEKKKNEASLITGLA